MFQYRNIQKLLTSFGECIPSSFTSGEFRAIIKKFIFSYNQIYNLQLAFFLLNSTAVGKFNPEAELGGGG